MSAGIIAAVVLAVIVLMVVIVALMLAGPPSKREQIEQERLESEARINKVTYAALQRLFEESRRGSSPWDRP